MFQTINGKTYALKIPSPSNWKSQLRLCAVAGIEWETERKSEQKAERLFSADVIFAVGAAILPSCPYVIRRFEIKRRPTKRQAVPRRKGRYLPFSSDKTVRPLICASRRKATQRRHLTLFQFYRDHVIFQGKFLFFAPALYKAHQRHHQKSDAPQKSRSAKYYHRQYLLHTHLRSHFNLIEGQKYGSL